MTRSDVLRRLGALALMALVQAAAIGLVALLHWRAPAGALTSADFLAGDGPAPPPGAHWQPVALPHAWWSSGHRDAGQGWYRLRLPVPDDAAEIRAVLLWQVGVPAEIFFNGSALAGMAPVQDSAWSQPMYVPIPPARWQMDRNELVIRVPAAQAGAGFLGPVYVGPAGVLQKHYQARRFLKVEVIQISAIMMLAMASAVCLLGLWRGGGNLYTWLGVSGIAWAGTAFTYEVFGTGALPDWVFAALTNTVAVALTLFIHRYLELSRAALERGLLVLAVLGNLGLLLLAAAAPDAFYLAAEIAWLPLSVALFAYSTALLFRRFWHSPGSGGYWLLQAIAVTLCLSLYDLAVYSGAASPAQGLMADYSAPFMLFVFILIVLHRFHLSLIESETLNLDLAERVRKKQREIEASYEALKRSEQQRLLAEERERIQRDVHDGLGGTLMSALARLDLKGERDSPAAASLRRALEDLRLLIYSLDQTGGALRDALGVLRERLARLAEAVGLVLEWDVDELPPELALDRGAVLQVLRIVQEAFANTAKHAGAHRFGLRAAAQAAGGRPGAIVEVRDDGRGFDPDAVTGGGYGLASMRSRVARLGGELEITALAPGTSILLWVPLAA